MIHYPSPAIPVDQSTLRGQAVLRCYRDYQPEGNGADLEQNKTSDEIITLFSTSRSFSPLGREKGPFLPGRKEGQRDIWTFTMIRLVHSNVPILGLRLLLFLSRPSL